MAWGWQAKPMLEQAAGASWASREQLTQLSVHRLQFGGPFCIETSSGTRRGGISISAARAAPPANPDIASTARTKGYCRMPPLRALTYVIVSGFGDGEINFAQGWYRNHKCGGEWRATYRHSTLVIS
jgi:hypothetical protein